MCLKKYIQIKLKVVDCKKQTKKIWAEINEMDEKMVELVKWRIVTLRNDQDL